MVARAGANSEPRLVNVPSLPFFERLAPSAPAEDYVAEIELYTKPGDVVLDLNGRGGWVARTAISEQRRAADFEAWPLTRLLADVVLRPPDIRQIDSAATAIANAPFSGSTIKRAIDALYASSCPRCGRPVILEAMIWHPLPASETSGPGSTAAKPRTKTGRAKGSSAGSAASAAHLPDLSPAAAALMPYAFSPEESLQAVAREYRCAQCHEQVARPIPLKVTCASPRPSRQAVKFARRSVAASRRHAQPIRSWINSSTFTRRVRCSGSTPS